MAALLIIGSPRSGTTLLASMVGGHPDVAMLVEDLRMTITKVAGKRIAGNKLCVPNQIQLTARRPPPPPRIARAARAVWRSNRPQAIPTSYHSIEDYLALEESCVLAIIRDGNDVISSIVRRGGREEHDAVARWCAAVETIADVRQRWPDRSMVVSYEKLVTRPGAEMQRVSRFLGLDFDERMLQGYKYNPIYPEEPAIRTDGIDQARREGFDYPLAAHHPEAYRRYELLRLDAQA